MRIITNKYKLKREYKKRQNYTMVESSFVFENKCDVTFINVKVYTVDIVTISVLVKFMWWEKEKYKYFVLHV